MYNLEVSFIYRFEEQTVIIILHVLFVKTEHLLPLYKFVSLPIHFNFSANISVTYDISQADLIAIGDTEIFQTLLSSDLASCKHPGSTFFCEDQTVLKTNIVHDCMGSLFLASSMLIKANCKFRISDTREKIFSLGNNTWLVYSVCMIATNHVCPKARSSSPMTISSGQAITVHPGCYILTMDHIITADDTNDVEIHSTWLDFTMSLAQLFDHSNSEQITQIVTELQSKITGAFDASELLQKFQILTLVVLITSSNDWNGAFTRFYFVPSVKKVLCKAFTTHTSAARSIGSTCPESVQHWHAISCAQFQQICGS